VLSLPEKIIFIILAFASLYSAWLAADRIIRIIHRGHGKVDWGVARKRLLEVIVKVGSMQPTFRIRLLTSLFHAFIAWGFIYYLLVNLGDVLEGFFAGFRFLGDGIIGHLYRLGGDLLSVAVLVGMLAMVVRRWGLRPPSLTTRQDVQLGPRVRAGIQRDSGIVAAFILIHVGSRFTEQAIDIASGQTGAWQPFASLYANLFNRLDNQTLIVLQHVAFWLALGTILGFIPYFLYSKHIHLFFAPLNYLLKPERPSMGALDRIDFDDESLEQFGATRLEDLGWEQIMDSYACIMCYRCQEVCPAYNTGKVLSPATMEINKRYFLNREGAKVARGETSSQTLVEFAISPEAVWACTACGACVQICPVNNEPMRDILDIRRALVLMENQFPKQFQTAFRGMERSLNPWNVPPGERMRWAEGLKVPTIAENPEPDILWWVGCAPATDARAQKTARAFAQILNTAGVNYAVLGEQEACNGDAARRAGKEDLFFQLATANVETLNEVKPLRIVTTCPHCLHVLKNEYPAFGGNYTVVHHTQFINDLITVGRIKFKESGQEKITYHDPCYLGRQNGILDAPRSVLNRIDHSLIELPRHGEKSFCCGAGGAQMWKEEEHGTSRVNANRMKEAIASGADKLAVGCPFCMIMLTDAAKDASASLAVQDLAEIVLSDLER
jgi:Fe-S oxidoreductase